MYANKQTNKQTNKQIVIALAADLGYQVQVETLIKSLCYHHTNLRIYLLHKTFPDEWFEIWNKKLALLSSEIIPAYVNDDYSKYNTLNHINEVGFYRYCIPFLEEERVLYLDSDIVVDSNLSEMYWRQFGDCPLFAVTDYVHNNIPVYTDLEINPYFNSGVLLINNTLWRELQVYKQLITINEKAPNLQYGDQDVLNIYFKDSWIALPIEYNYQTEAIIELVYRRKLESLAQEKGYLNVKPKIIHFTSRFKPWINQFVHPSRIPMREKYWFYYNLEWQDVLARHRK